MDSDSAAAYLRRIGADAPTGAPSVRLLHDLHVCHLRTVPFENLGIHLGEPIVLDETALLDKIVRRRRGGFCYELNGLFAELLTALGFQVTRHAARVFSAEGRLGIPFDHLALVVEIGGERWLPDVGVGRRSTYPLRLDWPDQQDDPEGKFLVVDAPDGDVDLLRDGKPLLRLERRPRVLADFVSGCWWHQTSPESHFTRTLVCSRQTPEGRVTLNGNQLITTVGDERTETTLASDEAILDTYRTIFGFELDRSPAIR